LGQSGSSGCQKPGPPIPEPKAGWEEQGRRALFQRAPQSLWSTNPFLGDSPAAPAPAWLLTVFCTPRLTEGWGQVSTPGSEGGGGRPAITVLSKCSRCRHCNGWRHACFLLPRLPEQATKNRRRKESVSKAVEQNTLCVESPG
jgi:hypothetical protein